MKPNRPELTLRTPNEIRAMKFDYDSKLIRRHRTYLELVKRNGKGYPIEYCRMNTAEKLTGWIFHLYKKEGMTPEHIVALIEAARDLGVKIDFPSKSPTARCNHMYYDNPAKLGSVAACGHVKNKKGFIKGAQTCNSCEQAVVRLPRTGWMG